MKESLRFTLYEILGYLMPGLIAAAALTISLWTIFRGDSVLPLSLWRLSPTGVLAVLFVAYVIGHLVQALANPVLKGADKRIMSDNDPAILVAKQRAAKLFQGTTVNISEICDTWLERVMDERCIRVGQQGDREIFTYREGFYRGSTVASVLFCAGLVVCIFTGKLRLLVGDTVFAPSRCELSVVLLISALGAWGLYKRFQRFSEYRVNRVIAAFIALP
ncbi:MAG TPA: hypothetical protein VJW96_04915 [Terriglobales bacterium]|jgi:hypothetical protein|nr:hypothetical protein [Terriglobales bacterium]